jgi:hypothetical protein
MPRLRDEFVEHGGVDRSGVGDHLGGLDLQYGDCPLEEPPSRISVPASRDQHVDDLPILVDRPVHVAPHPVDLDVRLVHKPSVAWQVAGEPSGVGQQRREPLHPAEDGDVVNLNTAFDQQFLDVAVGQAVAQVPAHLAGGT